MGDDARRFVPPEGVPLPDLDTLMAQLSLYAEEGLPGLFERLRAAAATMMGRLYLKGVDREDAEAALEFAGALVTLKLAIERQDPPAGRGDR